MSDLDFSIPGVEMLKTSLLVRFEDFAEKQNFESEQQGRPIYKTKTYIRMTKVGGKEEVAREAKEQDKQKYPMQFAAYVSGKSQAVIGTPIETFPLLETSQVATLKALSILSVEQLAAVSDNDLDKLGMGARELRSKAQGFIQAAKDCSHVTKLSAENERLSNEIAILKEEIKKISKKYDEDKKTK